MKVYLDDEELFEIDATMLALFAHKVADPIPDIKRRLQWVIEHWVEVTAKEVREQGIPLLKADGVTSVPVDDKAVCVMVFARPGYKNAAVKVAEEQASRLRS